MALDALMTKTADTTAGPATYYATGAIASGGSAVDEFDLQSGPITSLLEFGVFLTATRSGTSPTMDITWEFSDTVAFSTIIHTMTMKQVTAAIPAAVPARMAIHGTTRAKYCRCKAVTAGTSANFGIITAYVSEPQSHREGQGATFDR